VADTAVGGAKVNANGDSLNFRRHLCGYTRVRCVGVSLESAESQSARRLLLQLVALSRVARACIMHACLQRVHDIAIHARSSRTEFGVRVASAECMASACVCAVSRQLCAYLSVHLGTWYLLP
jgi:hypothetical protein